MLNSPSNSKTDHPRQKRTPAGKRQCSEPDAGANLTGAELHCCLRRDGHAIGAATTQLLIGHAADVLTLDIVTELACSATARSGIAKSIVLICAPILSRGTGSVLEWQGSMERLALHLFPFSSRRSPISRLESLLSAPGAITRLPPDLGTDMIFVWRCDSDDAAGEFAVLLRRTRKNMGITQASFAARYAAWGLKQVAVSAWERGSYLPSRAEAGLIARIAVTCDLPQLYAAYSAARERLEKEKPRAAARDVDFSAFLCPYEDIITLLVGGGNRHTMLSYRQAISYTITVYQLSVSVSARTRGLGRHYPMGPLALLDPAVIDYLPDFFAARRGGERGTFSDRLTYRRLATLTKPHSGAVWCHADVLARLMPASVRPAWLATHWPDGSDSPGAPCRSLVESIRAGCYLAHARYQECAGDCAAQPYARRTHLDAVVDGYAHPLVGVFEWLRLLVSAPRSRRAKDQHSRNLLAAMFAACSLRAAKSEDDCSHWQICARDDGGYDLCVPSQGDAEILRVAIPRALGAFVAPYDSWRKTITTPGLPYFLDGNGHPVTRTALDHRARKFSKLLAPDVFPRGVCLRDMPSIVATELALRYGAEQGCALAAAVFSEPAERVRHRLLLTRCRESVRARGKNNPTIDDAITAAWREAMDGDGGSRRRIAA